MVRSDKYVSNNDKGDFMLNFGESVRHTQKGIEITNRFPGEVGTLIITNFRVFWFSEKNNNHNASIGFQRVLAVGRKKINSDEADETQVVCILTYDSPSHKEYTLKNTNDLQDLKHIKIFMELFRSYTSTKPYRDVMISSSVIENKQLKLLPAEEVFTLVDGVKLLNDNGVLGRFIITNIRSIWFADDDEQNNLSMPYLCVEQVNLIPTEYGEAVTLEVEEEYQLFGWTFHVEPQEKQQNLLDNLYNMLVEYNKSPIVGF